MNYYAYILVSLKDGKHYYGSTSNLQKRLVYHNTGKSKFTKGHRPWEIKYIEEFETRSDAMKREKYFKSIDGYNFLKENKII